MRLSFQIRTSSLPMTSQPLPLAPETTGPVSEDASMFFEEQTPVMPLSAGQSPVMPLSAELRSTLPAILSPPLPSGLISATHGRFPPVILPICTLFLGKQGSRGVMADVEDVQRGLAGSTSFDQLETLMTRVVRIAEEETETEMPPMSVRVMKRFKMIAIPLNVIELLMRWMSTSLIRIYLSRVSFTSGPTRRLIGIDSPSGGAYRLVMERTDKAEMCLGTYELYCPLMMLNVEAVLLVSFVEFLAQELRLMNKARVGEEYVSVVFHLLHAILSIEARA
jgi:hypothetical protein